jgi:hypothetical protein
MFLAKAHQRRSLGSLGALHRHQQFLPTSTGGMKRKEAGVLGTLDTSTFADVANGAFLSNNT